jgi:hypothetical protein
MIEPSRNQKSPEAPMLSRHALIRLAAPLLIAVLLAGAAGAAGERTTVYLPLASKALPPPFVAAVRTTGAVGASAASGSTLYVATGPGLEVLDAAAAPPRRLGAVTLPIPAARIGGIVAVGAHLYVAGASQDERGAWRNQLLAFDRSDPAAPRLIATVALPGGPGSRLYLAGSPQRLVVSTDVGLQIFELADPAAPRLAGTLQGSGDVRPAVYGVYLYLSGQPIVDTTNPALPRLLGPPLPVAAGMAVVGDVLSILTPEYRLIDGARCADNRLQTYRLADPLAPAPAGYAQLTATGPNTPGGRCLSYGIAAAAPGRIVLSNDETAQVVDTGDPLAPVAGGQLPWLRGARDLFGSPLHSAIAGTVWFVPRTAGAWVADLADPQRPRELPAFEQPLPARLGRVFKAGAGYALVADGDPVTGESSLTYALLQLGDGPPRLVGARQRVAQGFALLDAVVDGDRLYVLEGRFEDSSVTLRVFTGVRGGELRPAGALQLGRGVSGAVARAGYVYALGSSGLIVVDVRDDAAPRVAKTLELPRSWELALDGELLRVRVAAGDTGAEDRAYSLANPADPVEVARTPSDWRWLGFPGDAPIVYRRGYGSSPCARCTVDRLEILERRPGDTPLLRGRLDLGFYGYPALPRYSLGNGFVVYSIAGGGVDTPGMLDATLVVVDVRDPDAPAFAAVAGGGYGVRDHALLGRAIVAAEGDQGLAVYPVPPQLP